VLIRSSSGEAYINTHAHFVRQSIFLSVEIVFYLLSDQG